MHQLDPHLAVLHLDRLWHTTNYDAAAKTWFIKQQQEFMTTHTHCLIDGNYQGTMPYRLEKADVILWLKTSRVQGVYRAIKRSVQTKILKKHREDMAPEFEDKWDREFLEFLIFIWRFKDKNEKEIGALIKKYSDKKVVTLKNQREKTAFLKQFQQGNI